MKKTWNTVLAMSRPMLFGVVGIIIAAGLMGWRLGNLTPGLSEPELATYTSAHSLSAIADNAVNAPYKFAVYLATTFLYGEFGLRLTGALVGFGTIILFYFMAQKILTASNALITTALFATTSLLLHTARIATPDVMLLMLLALVALGSFIRFNKKNGVAWLLASAAIALSLYTPGLAFFILAGAAWQFRHIKSSFEDLRPAFIISCGIIFSLLITPLVVSLIRDPGLWRAYLGIPETLPSLSIFAERTVQTITAFFVISPANPVYWLGRQPILDVFATAMFIYGFITVVRHYRLERLILFVGVFLLAVLWIALSGNHQGVILLLPFMYVVIGLGIQEILDKWFDVFPRNPIARTTGALVLAVVVLLSINFQTQRYFVAWANSPDTVSVYQKQLPKK